MAALISGHRQERFCTGMLATFGRTLFFLGDKKLVWEMLDAPRCKTFLSLSVYDLRDLLNALALERAQAWKQQYDNPNFRHKFLVLRGDSRSGKTTLAKSLFANPFVQSAQSATAPELREYDWTFHRCVIFDNVNTEEFVLNFRAMLKANNDEHILGSSATGIYSYRIWLWKVPIVLTVDLHAKWDSENSWIKENCVEVMFDAPVYEPLNQQNFV
jgi:hypothetical protein